MIKFWFYAFVMLFLVIIGLAIGSANEAMITFDFLIVKTKITVATVLVIGVGFGFLLGVYASLLLCIKLWFKAKLAQVSLNKLKKQVESNEKVG